MTIRETPTEYEGWTRVEGEDQFPVYKTEVSGHTIIVEAVLVDMHWFHWQRAAILNGEKCRAAETIDHRS
jgi:hypothetical protein